MNGQSDEADPERYGGDRDEAKYAGLTLVA
jgi:hypothetical protein